MRVVCGICVPLPSITIVTDLELEAAAMLLPQVDPRLPARAMLQPAGHNGRGESSSSLWRISAKLVSTFIALRVCMCRRGGVSVIDGTPQICLVPRNQCVHLARLADTSRLIPPLFLVK